MNSPENPFAAKDEDRSDIWTMLVERDIAAFIGQDWALVENDFDSAAFQGLDAAGSDNPDSWKLRFPSLEVYRDEWLRQAAVTAATQYAEDVSAAIHRATTLRDIEISGTRAVAHKKFDGTIRRADGTVDRLNWQTLYYLTKASGSWRINGFTGYLPNPMGSAQQAGQREAISLPAGADQHVTAGPYSPVLEVAPGKLVVISGQVAVAPDGSVIGETIEEQSRATLDNCRTQLASAGCSLGDVFKVNVYLTDLDLWPRFNAVYAKMMPEPRPVRTAVGTALLPGLIVEIEMWAVKP
ncbi:MAG: RidA family protein [Rhizobiaceae bacterium]|nr:RidA family protein [Rhizobiaceae bacterium]